MQQPKVLAISGSIRKEGNTEFFLRHALRIVEEEGLDTEFISLRGLTFLPCDGCYTCLKTGKCYLKGDDFESTYQKMREADGLIIGSSVYFSSVVPQLLALLDRAAMVARGEGKLFSGKVGGPVTVARRAGHNMAFAELLLWFFANDFIIVGSDYWTVGMAGRRGARDAAQDSEGQDHIAYFACNMARLLRRLKRSEALELAPAPSDRNM